MGDDKLKEFIKDTQEGIGYFQKLRKGRKPQMERLEEAVEGPAESSPLPEPEKKLRDKSTGGSPPFSEAELRKGYRKL
jgi:Sec-independent protein translocase protein TatA